MSRSNAASKTTSIKSNIQQPCNSWIFLLQEKIIDRSEYQNDIVTLRHPSSGEGANFLLSQVNGSIYEILTYSEGKRSWFIDDTVKSDGRLKISTPVDPVFLVLPYLRKHCSDQAAPLDQILNDEKYPVTERLLKCDGLKYLTSVADKKDCQDIVAYKYNETKTLMWLKKKTDNLAKVLKQKNIHLTSDATSATFKKACNEESIKDDAYLRYAAGIVCDYLAEDLSEKLFKYLDLPEKVVAVKRKSDASNTRESPKKIKLDEELSSRRVNKTVSKTRKSPIVNPKSKFKAGNNTRSILSFFKKS